MSVLGQHSTKRVAHLGMLGLAASVAAGMAFDPPDAKPVGGDRPAIVSSDRASKPPAQVEVQPVARDAQIEQRLKRILTATGWFIDPQVEVRDGVAFLSGSTGNEDFKKWAGGQAERARPPDAAHDLLPPTTCCRPPPACKTIPYVSVILTLSVPPL